VGIGFKYTIGLHQPQEDPTNLTFNWVLSAEYDPCTRQHAERRQEHRRVAQNRNLLGWLERETQPMG
jgi:hypothetical protein